MKILRAVSAALALAASLGVPRASAQGTLLLREIVSREVTVAIGGAASVPEKNAESRELAIFIDKGPSVPFGAVISREHDLAIVNDASPPALTGVQVLLNATGTSATLDWSAYNFLGVGDVQRFDIYLSDAGPLTIVTGLTPFASVGGASTTVAFNNLAAYQDHFFAVVAVDALGHFSPVVNFAAGYVLSPQVTSRELTVSIGADAAPLAKQAVSREIDLVVADAAAPPRVTGLAVTVNAAGDTATLDWSAYNFLGVGDVGRFDIYLSDVGPFTSVTGLTPFATVGGATTSLTLTGLAAGRDHFFAVVPVDGLAHFDPQVNFAAAYVLVKQLVSREITAFVGEQPAFSKQVIAREMSVVVPDAAVPAPVTGVGSGFAATTSQGAFGAVDLDWTSYNEYGQNDVARYRIYVGNSFFNSVAGLTPYQTVQTGRQTQTVTGLTGGGVYHFAVVAEDVGGRFDPAVRSFSAQASISGVGEATNLAGVSGATTINFSWQPPPDSGSFLRGYRVYFGGATVPVELPASATSYSATGLQPATGYPFRITTLDPFGGESGGVSLLGATLLPNPVNVQLTARNGQVVMTWNAAQPSALVSTYEVYRSNSAFTNISAATRISSDPATEATLGSFAAVSGKHYAVVTVNVLGSSDPAVVSTEATKQFQSIDFPAPTVAGSAPISLPAAASSGLPVRFEATPAGLAQIVTSGATPQLSTLSGGRVTVTAFQDGNANFWPADPVARALRLPPLFTAFTASGTEITGGITLRQIDELLRVTALDVDGIAQAEFFIRPAAGGAFTSLGVDNIPGNGFTATLPLDAFAAGSYELKVAVATPDGITNETTRAVVLQLGAPPPPILTASANGTTVDTAQITVSGTTTRGALISVLRNGVEVAGPLTPNGVGEFSASIGLVPGDNIFTARATNSAGSSSPSLPRTVTLRSLLTVEITPGSLAEGASGTIRVARNHAQGAVTVALAASVPGQVTLPASVTVPAGATEASVAFSAVDDTKAEADQAVTITGTAAGYVPGSATVTVLDDDRTNLPDLIVTNITAPAQALPGQEIELVWTLKNQGPGKAAAGWTDQIFVSEDHVIGSDRLLATSIATAALPAGQSIERRLRVTLPSLTAGAKYIVIRTNAGGDVFEADAANNSAIDDAALTVQTALTLELARISTPENGGGIVATVTRNGDATTALAVALSAAPPEPVSFPASVTIPANAASVTFTVQPLDDPLINGDRTVNFNAHAAAGYLDATATLQILDDDVPGLAVTLSPSSVAETAGNPASTGTVRRNTATTGALTVGLLSSDPTAASVPATVVIPAGAASATFPITVSDDLIVTNARTVRITASAAGFDPHSATLEVTDDDIPSLSLRLAPNAVSENADNPAASGRVVFTTAAQQDVTINLASSDVALATVPATVIVRAGATAADFPIAVTNQNRSGAQDVTITATQTDSVLHQPIPGQSDQQVLHVYGSSGASLSLSGPATISLAQATVNFTVGRQPGTTGAVTVALSSDASAVTVPASVIIPDGQATKSVSLTAAAVGTATITASSSGFNSAALGVTVTNANLPDLMVDSVTPAKLSAASGETINIAWTVTNEGGASATGNWIDGVYLTTDRLSIADTLRASAAAAGPLATGSGYQANASVTMPATPGRYWAVIRTDVRGDLTEGAETNNLLVASQPIDVGPAYTATVSTTVTVAGSGTPVALRGLATRTADGAPAAEVPVAVRILVNGTRRILTALTDAHGQYLTTFRPLPTEAGQYTVAAAQPEVTQDTVQAQFELIGISANPQALDLRLAVQQPVSGTLDLSNLSDHPLSGLTAVVQSAAANITGTVQVPGSLAANGAGQLQYTLTAANDNFTRAKVVLHVSSAEGVVLDIPVQVEVIPRGSQLVANPGTLNRGMLRGAQTLVDCDLVNLGAAPSGDLTVEIPNLPWLALASPAAIPSLAPGQHAKITVQLLPAANLPLQLFNGNLFVRAGQSGLSIPFSFRAISAAVGDVKINVLDDYTYYTPDAPRVANATVRLRDAFDQAQIVAEGITDDTGSVTLTGVPEAAYALEVSAVGHGTYRNVFPVLGGIVNAQDVFIDRQTISYTWQVVPTEISDRYDIKLVATFETDVPVPVVTLEPSISTLPDLADGESVEVDLTLTNHGLIAAEQVSLHVPGPESGFQYTPLITQLNSIAAKSSVVVPMVVRRTVAGQVSNALKTNPRFAGGAGGGGGGGDCVGFCFAVYSYICGPDRKFHQAAGALVTGLSCPGGAGASGFIPFGLAGGPGGGSGIFPSIKRDDDCDPCAAGNLKTVFDCALGFVPGGAPAKCLYGIANCLNDASHGNVTSPYVCFRSAQGCGGAAAGPIGSVLDCAVGFIQNALDCKAAMGKGKSTKAVTRTVSHYQVRRDAAQNLAFSEPATASGADEFALLNDRIGRVQDEVDALTYVYGDAVWLHGRDNAAGTQWMDAYLQAITDSSNGGAQVSATERSALLALPLPPGVTPPQATALLDRNNRTATYNASGILDLADVPAGQSTDFFARDVATQKFSRFSQSYLASLAEGFESPDAGLLDALQQQRNQPQKKTQGVCAQVKIEIDQQAVLTRQAFSGTLEVTNGSATSAISGVNVVLDIRDEAGNSANDKFFVTTPTVSGLADAGGAGVLAAGAVARLQYTFIPTHDAAPSAPTVYRFAGTLQYNDGGQTVAVPLLPSPVRVYPDARLVLKYFEQRDVYSDDPFTPGIEPAEPFALGLLVTNIGGGVAKDFTITSAQPKIIDNQKGLLVDFKIIGTQVGAEAREPSLTVDLGDLEPGDSQVAQFILTASLQGKFIDYQASYAHADELGGQATSLIDGVEIHELIHAVRDDRAGADELPDFLTNEIFDANSLPDTLYLSNGAIAPVNLATNATATIGTLQGALTANMPTGWSYVQLPDPGAGSKLTRVVRSDGKVLRVGDNVWQTDRSFPNALSGALRERLIHLLDFDGTGSYTLYYTVATDPGFLTPPVQIAHLGPVTPALRTAPLDSIDVTFTRPIDPASFTAADVSLSVNGGASVAASGVTISPLGETSYRLSGLAGLNAAEGTYAVTVQAGTVVDVAGSAGQGSATAIWAVSTTHLAAVSAGGFGGATVRGPVATIDVVFSRAVAPATLSVDDFTLSRDGGANLLTAAVTITQTTPTTFRIGGLGTLTAPKGSYAFTVAASTITDTDGLAGVGALTEGFTIDATGPTIESLDQIAPNPRNSAISTLDLAFSKPIDPATFGAPDLKLSRNGKAISLGTTHIIALDDRHFRLAGLAEPTGIAGSYALEVSAAGVTDLLGNPGTGSVARTWTLGNKQPGAPHRLAITPDRGTSATDGITNTAAVAITGAVGSGVTRVRASDRTTGASLGEGAVSGTRFNLPIQFTVAGLHEVAVIALDAAGNASAPGVARIFIDLTAPTATLAAVSPSPRETPVTSLSVTFSEALKPASFSKADLTLTRDGTVLALGKSVTIQPAAAGAYVVDGLGTLTDPAGVYELKVTMAGVEDLAGNAGQGAASVRWRRLAGSKLRQFEAFAGNYNGLILATEPAHATSGIIHVALTRVGGFSATATYAGRKLSLKGTLDADGKFTGIAGQGASALGVALTLVTDEGANAMVGTISSSTAKTGFVADRLLYSRTAPTPLAGKYVALFTAEEDGAIGAPEGDGFGVLTIAPEGTSSFVGEFADGTKFSQKTALGGADELPFYVSTDAGQGSAVARLFFREIEALSDLDGTVHWFRPARPKAKSLASAFIAHLPLVGSAYTAPNPGQPIFDFGTVGQKADMILSGVGIDPDLVLPFTFDAHGAGVFSAPGAFRPQLKLSLADGRITGKVLLTGDRATTSFRGVAFPKQMGGSGYFMRLRSGGTVELKPAP